MELDLKAAHVVFTSIGFAPKADDDASSIGRGSNDRPISTSPITCDLYWEPCSGLLDLPLEPQEYVMSVRCSGSSSMKNADTTFFDCPASDAKYPQFHTFTADLEKRFGTPALPVMSDWYEVRIRYVAHVCKSNKAPLAVVYALKPISPPSTPDVPEAKSTKQLEYKDGDHSFERKSTSSMASSALQSSTASSGMPSLPLDPQLYALSARCFLKKGDMSLFECPGSSANLEQRFGTSGLPVVGGWYEVRLRNNLFADKSKDAPLAFIYFLKPMHKPLQPYFNALTSAKQLEDNEYVVSAECTEFKGDETLFRCVADGFTCQIFMTKTTKFPRADAPMVGQWYELTLRFFTTKNPVAPAVDISCAMTISRPNKPYFQKRPVASDCHETSTNAPRAGASLAAGSVASWNCPKQDMQELTAVVCGQPNAREFELYSPTGWQSEPCFYTPKF